MKRFNYFLPLFLLSPIAAVGISLTSCKSTNNAQLASIWLSNETQIFISKYDDFNKLCNSDDVNTTITIHDYVHKKDCTFKKADISEFWFGIDFNLDTINDDFLANCINLIFIGSEIGNNIGDDLLDTLPSTINTIGNNFLSGCTYFDQYSEIDGIESELIIPDSVYSIGDNFLADCVNFNSSLHLSQSCVSIGNNFLAGCTRFDLNFTIPDEVQKIGDYFLMNCQSFNKEFGIPTSINTIGKGFLSGCEAHDTKIFSKNESKPELWYNDEPGEQDIDKPFFGCIFPTEWDELNWNESF